MSDLADKVKMYLGVAPHDTSSKVCRDQYQVMVKEYGKATVDGAVRAQAMTEVIEFLYSRKQEAESL